MARDEEMRVRWSYLALFSLNKMTVLRNLMIFIIKERFMSLHIKDIYKMMDLLIEARDMLNEKYAINKRIESTVSKIDEVIKESYEEKNRR
tara:strand:+ start:867 stop:1139 length:273 start_codon:yes stop_codon:yes gene_type:complete